MMKIERDDVHFPIWRKKVDWSLLNNGVTPIPKWVCKIWNIPERFSEVSSKKDPKSKVSIQFEKNSYSGNITLTKGENRKSPMYRLFIEQPLAEILRTKFPMSFVRGLEARLSGVKEETIAEKTQFWEFLDLEMDQEYQISLNCHYNIVPQFPAVFQVFLKNFTEYDL